jgi:hypothetical protein
LPFSMGSNQRDGFLFPLRGSAKRNTYKKNLKYK